MGRCQTNECLITGLPAVSTNYFSAGYTYTIMIKDGKKIHLEISDAVHKWEDNQGYKKKKHLIAGAIINGIFFENQSSEIYKLHDLDDILSRLDILYFPISPSEKLDQLFEEIIHLQQFDGQWINSSDILNNHYIVTGNYFRSKEECSNYLNYINKLGYLSFYELSPEGSGREFQITFEGLKHFYDLKQDGRLSNKCFVAMAFNEHTKGIREAIREAVGKTGFHPIFMDEIIIDADRTINDAIISNMKSCNFCIADFTFHRNGVYFESGFVLGQNKKVIYTCHKNDFENAHFDIKPLQHIIYNNENELLDLLTTKINAYIK